MVGVSEELDRFLALVGIEMGWPSDVLCLPLAHTRRKDELKEGETRNRMAGPKV